MLCPNSSRDNLSRLGNSTCYLALSDALNLVELQSAILQTPGAHRFVAAYQPGTSGIRGYSRLGESGGQDDGTERSILGAFYVVLTMAERKRHATTPGVLCSLPG